MNNSGNMILLEWEEPFTWPNHDILIYIIKEMDSEGSRRFSTLERSHAYTITPGVRSSCEPVMFMVIAVSDIGWSDPATSNAFVPRGNLVNLYML